MDVDEDTEMTNAGFSSNDIELQSERLTLRSLHSNGFRPPLNARFVHEYMKLITVRALNIKMDMCALKPVHVSDEFMRDGSDEHKPEMEHHVPNFSLHKKDLLRDNEKKRMEDKRDGNFFVSN